MRDLVAQIEERMIRARIKQARKEAGLTQHQLAELIEVIPRSVQNYEDVEAGRVPWAKLNQIAAAVGKSSEWLIHGDPLEAISSKEAEDLRREFREGVREIREAVEDLRRALEEQAKREKRHRTQTQSRPPRKQADR